ncbi:MAG: hypothetical protein KGZ25_10870, partial [Planctomycetes bacterium]|nr:hypothetical protein [Planctomycetota bacterium]
EPRNLGGTGPCPDLQLSGIFQQLPASSPPSPATWRTQLNSSLNVRERTGLQPQAGVQNAV